MFLFLQVSKGKDSFTRFANGSVCGANAGRAYLGRAEVGIENTPFKAHAEGPGANAKAGFSADHIGFSAGAHLAEVQVGPFAARAGLKFGLEIVDGILVVHDGPISTPCSLL